jgi:hypothetical protein
MDSRAFWLRLKTHRWVYSFSIAATLAAGYFNWHGGFLRSEGQGRAEVLRRDSVDDSFAQAAFQ